MKSITIESTLDAPADVVWSVVQRPEAFVHVAGAMLRYPAAERHGGPWRQGDETVGWLFLFRLIPFSRHTIRVFDIDHDAMTLLTEEGGGLVRLWRHHVSVRAVSDDRCRYTDRIEIDAGILTPIVVTFARAFYRYRQRRWARLAPLLSASASPEARPSSSGETQLPS
jgi:hypothetical protein